MWAADTSLLPRHLSSSPQCLPQARLEEDSLRDAAHDAFMAFWCGVESDRVLLWAAYCEAQERYDTYLLRRA